MVSIIVPVYNTESYLHRCIESILGQIYPDFELILIDDGSTDSSGSICDSYVLKDSRVNVIHTNNHGVSSARNCGLNIARGEWISFVDSDDYVTSRFLSDMLAKSFDSDIVVSGWRRREFRMVFPDRIIVRDNFIDVFVSEAFRYMCGKLFRRSVLERTEVRFEVDVRWAEDSIFFINALLRSNKVILTSDINYYYELREDSAIVKLNPYENELAAVKVVDALMPQIREICSLKVREYFSTYQFVLRTFYTVRNMDIGFKDKLMLLKEIKFIKKYLYLPDATIKEKVFARLVKYKQWRILLWLKLG